MKIQKLLVALLLTVGFFKTSIAAENYVNTLSKREKVELVKMLKAEKKLSVFVADCKNLKDQY